MGKPLRVLIVEDVENDAQLLLRELARGGYTVTSARVETDAQMTAALTNEPWDIIISDYSMPQFTALLALAVVKRLKVDVPFVVVSGTVGEDTAVEALRAGANDFMAKGKFARLIPALERELHDHALRIERNAMQEQLLISDRMASVGTLAAGVAHEINNPLAALMANLDFVVADLTKLGAELGAGSVSHESNDWIATRLRSIAEPLADARECADRVRHIVRDLKLFSRSGEEQNEAVDVQRVIDSSLRIAWNEILHRARLVKDYGNVPLVAGNEARLGQVFLNLIVNAAQAIPEGRADKNEIRIVTRQDDRGRVVVEVRDSGAGIPEAVLPKIFDSFFTTKPIGVGTGLGLAICHRIVTALHGQIAVESQLGKGTVFRVTLDVATNLGVVAEPVQPVVAATKRGRILVVDDELMLGRAVKRMLSAEHEVVAVTRASEAIDFITRGERFDIIMSDLMMPEITGMDFHAELLRIAPEQAEKIIFMTGGAFTPQARAFLDRIRNPRLEKPFDESTLRSLIHSLLR